MESLGDVLPMLASCSAARPRSSWPSSVVVVAAFAALRLQDWVDSVVALVVAALALVLVLVLWGAVRGQLRRGGALVVEMARMAGMAGLTAIALAAVSVDPDLDATGVLGQPFFEGQDPEPLYPLTDEATGTTYTLTSGFVAWEPSWAKGSPSKA